MTVLGPTPRRGCMDNTKSLCCTLAAELDTPVGPRYSNALVFARFRVVADHVY